LPALLALALLITSCSEAELVEVDGLTCRGGHLAPWVLDRDGLPGPHESAEAALDHFLQSEQSVMGGSLPVNGWRLAPNEAEITTYVHESGDGIDARARVSSSVNGWAVTEVDSCGN
jgi:hypothetical protein